ncbi:MAG: hydroxymethylglutaryl-CoA lyase [SAR324 cluster bacterium]|nr:hydroxymethylglutaryl-CoA lyase [SAR324 cluster bacterium]
MKLKGAPVVLCDVGPRDGLQSEPRLFSVQERADLVGRLAHVGLPKVEAVSFVNPKRVPQMAEPEAVLDALDVPESTVIAGLALNERGVDRALETKLGELRYSFGVSETFNQRNQGKTVAESFAMFASTLPRVQECGLPYVPILSTVFGCPFEGEIAPQRVVELVQKLVETGADEVILGDTIGCAVPTQVSQLLEQIRAVIPEAVRIGMHFHNTRNTGLANVYAALAGGVRSFDASLGGLGGCPFAPRATGNICTEDLAYMLRNMDCETGIDLPRLLETANWMQDFFEAALPGQVMKAGLFPEVASQAA